MMGSRIVASNLYLTSRGLSIKCYNPEPEIWTLGDSAYKAFSSALSDSLSSRYKTITPQHLVIGIIRNAEARLEQLVPNHTLSITRTQKTIPARFWPRSTFRNDDGDSSWSVTSEFLAVLEQAISEARNLNAPFLNVDHLLAGLCKHESTSKLMADGNFTLDLIRRSLKAKQLDDLDVFIDVKPSGYDIYRLTDRVLQGLKGKYKVLRFVHSGGMGAIYAGLRFPKEIHNPPEKSILSLLGSQLRQVCIKFLKPDLAARYKNKFLEEIEVVKNLVHPNIVRILDTGETDEGWMFYVMEWVQGRSLAERIHTSVLTVEDCAVLLEDICEALHVAHQRKVIHLDVKPETLCYWKQMERRQR